MGRNILFIDLGYVSERDDAIVRRVGFLCGLVPFGGENTLSTKFMHGKMKAADTREEIYEGNVPFSGVGNGTSGFTVSVLGKSQRDI